MALTGLDYFALYKLIDDELPTNVSNLIKAVNTRTVAKRLTDTLFYLAPIKVLGFGVDTPVVGAAEGDTYVVGQTPTGDWAGQANAIAVFSDSIWQFLEPNDRMVCFTIANPEKQYVFRGTFPAGTWNIISSGNLTANGGINIESQVIKLGGSLIESVVIDGAGLHDFSLLNQMVVAIESSDSIRLEQTAQGSALNLLNGSANLDGGNNQFLNIIGTPGLEEAWLSTDGNINLESAAIAKLEGDSLQLISTGGNISMQSPYASLDVTTLGVEITDSQYFGYFRMTPTGVALKGAGATNPANYSELWMSSTIFQLTDQRATQHGVEYAADYSAGFNDLSLVNKKWVVDNFSAGSVTDGDYGDITVSGTGTVWTIDNDAVTFDKIQNITTNRVLARSSAGTGNIEELTLPNFRTLINVEDGATADQTPVEIKVAYESNPNTNEFSDSEKSKLAGLESSKFLGEYVSLAALQIAHPSPVIGSYANVDGGVGQDVIRYVWDSDDGIYVEQGPFNPALSDAQIKTQYENNANTNAYTDTEKTKLAGIEAGATTDQTDAEIAAAYQTEVPLVSQAVAEAGTATGIESWSALRVAQAIAAQAGGVPTLQQVLDQGSTATISAAFSVTTTSGVSGTTIGMSPGSLNLNAGAGGGHNTTLNMASTSTYWSYNDPTGNDASIQLGGTGNGVGIGSTSSPIIPTATLDVDGDMRVRTVNVDNALTNLLAIDGNGNVSYRTVASLPSGGGGGTGLQQIIFHNDVWNGNTANFYDLPPAFWGDGTTFFGQHIGNQAITITKIELSVEKISGFGTGDIVINLRQLTSPQSSLITYSSQTPVGNTANVGTAVTTQTLATGVTYNGNNTVVGASSGDLSINVPANVGLICGVRFPSGCSGMKVKVYYTLQ